MLIATGVYKSRDIDGPGAGLPGIVRAIDYLTASNRKGFGDEVPEFDSGELDAEGKRVVVIGGGDTAMDCVRTAIRQGAARVKCLYRRDRANMPGSQREVANAEEEGVEFVWLSAPEGFAGDDAVAGVRVQRMRLGAPDATGRRCPRRSPGADLPSGGPGDQGAGLRARGAARLWGAPGWRSRAGARSGPSSAAVPPASPGVFAAGDIVRGASLVVWAIRDGREAAEAILGWLDDPGGGGGGVADRATWNAYGKHMESIWVRLRGPRSAVSQSF